VSFFSNLTTPIEQIKGEAEKTDNYLLEVDNKLVIPTNKKVRLLFTSNDVIHAWWVPAFGVKKDSIPGFINESWVEVSEPGIYRGKCAELCGQNHGFMPVVVEVKSEEDYVAWLNTKKALAAEEAASADKTYTQAELMAQGEKVYKTACAACHQVNGEGLPPMFPGLKGSAVAMGDIAKHIDIIINGVSGTAMQAFGAQLNDADIAAVVTYERNAWGNDTGDVTQPADIKAAR
ncbi:MAG: c-type cytochrome, partial [Gammaproteobacteria bacterium]